MSTIQAGDPADALCVLYDEWVHRIDANHLELARERYGESDSLAAQVLRNGAVPDGIAVTSEADAAVAMVGLDRALAVVLPGTGSVSASSALPQVRAQLLATGHMNSAAPGALLAKRSMTTRPGPPNYLRDALTSVTRVSVAMWGRIDHVVVPAKLDLPVPSSGDVLKVATVAVTDQLGDFDIVEVTSPQLGYTVGPDASGYPVDRLRRALEKLDGTGAALAVLPEGVVDTELRERWRALVVDVPNDDTALTWIVVGSGPVAGEDPQRNRATIIHRHSGEVVGEQDKRAPFAMTDAWIRDYRLRDVLPTPGVHAEAIAVGSRLTVLESSAGRFCICICEDLTRLADVAPLFQECGPTHVLVPMFGKEIDEHSWPDVAAADFGSQIGASVVVVNSMAITRARRESGAAPGAGSALAYRYLGDGRVYPKLDLRESSDPDEVQVFDLHPRPY